MKNILQQKIPFDRTPKITPNQRQQEAIDTIAGPVMLLAGPGSGKTFTLIERIKNMLIKMKL